MDLNEEIKFWYETGYRDNYNDLLPQEYIAGKILDSGCDFGYDDTVEGFISLECQVARFLLKLNKEIKNGIG
jgi:hypothetical protein